MKFFIVNTMVVQMNAINTKLYRLTAILLLLNIAVIQTGCKKFVDIKGPVTSVNESNVYESDATAISALTGIYAGMISNSVFSGIRSFPLLAGLSSDELTLYNGVTSQTHIAYYRNALVSNSNQNVGSETWFPFYSIIFKCNAAIEGLNSTQSLTATVKSQLLGEAKFVRALAYFYLVNLFGDVPLTTATDPTVNAVLDRTGTQTLYHQIVDDLTDAKDLLSSDYLDGTLTKYASTERRLRPTRWAASCLLARVYLYNSDWAHAEEEATSVIGNSGLFILEALNKAFLNTSREAIWQLQPVKTNRNTEDAFIYIIPSTGLTDANGDAGNPVYISRNLLNAFEPNDQRRNGKWVDSITLGAQKYYYPSKYRATTGSVTEYLMVLRLGEQYLIRAEARAQLNNIGGAQADLNMIRFRAGLGNTTANDKTSLLAAILHEKQVELFTEWGHRWLDLKRTGTVDAIMGVVTPQKGGNWESTDKLYPLPFTDIQKDPGLSQNEGY